jgi:mannose-1-phosphate guanylyltransferase
LLERDVVEGIEPGRAVSMERDVFPALAGEGLYGYLAEAYWIDIGTPERYLEATWDLLAGLVESDLPPRDETGSLVGDGCLTAGARIGPQCVLGRRCLVGQDATVARSVLHDGVRIGERCELHECIVGEGARLGDGVHVESGAVIGPGARVDSGVVHGDARIEAAGAPA